MQLGMNQEGSRHVWVALLGLCQAVELIVSIGNLRTLNTETKQTQNPKVHHPCANKAARWMGDVPNAIRENRIYDFT